MERGGGVIAVLAEAVTNLVAPVQSNSDHSNINVISCNKINYFS
jgi:hypothetical protein